MSDIRDAYLRIDGHNSAEMTVVLKVLLDDRDAYDRIPLGSFYTNDPWLDLDELVVDPHESVEQPIGGWTAVFLDGEIEESSLSRFHYSWRSALSILKDRTMIALGVTSKDLYWKTTGLGLKIFYVGLDIPPNEDYLALAVQLLDET